MEVKFSWAFIDVQFNVVNGIVTDGRVYSDCLIPVLIDALNQEIQTGQITYDAQGISKMCKNIAAQF